MARTSPVHYIAPSAISISSNANNSADDLAVYVAKGARIKVYSQGVSELKMVNATWQEWTMSGRNRRLSNGAVPYTIYARLKKSDTSNAYLVFAQKEQDGTAWKDKYAYVTWTGLATGTANRNNNDYWYIKLGDVSAPKNGQRTVTLDTGILGTDQFNTSWNLDPDDMPLRVELDCSIDDKAVGDKPYVAWGKMLVMQARLVAGWVDTDVVRFDHWEILRNTGDGTADTEWNTQDRPAGFRRNGRISLSHSRVPSDDDQTPEAVDDFNGTFSSTFTVIAYGPAEEDVSPVSSADEDASSSSGSSSSGEAIEPEPSSLSSGDSSSSDSSSSGDGTALVKLAATTINIMAETAERYELVLSDNIVTYDSKTMRCLPAAGITIGIRGTDQNGNVYRITAEQASAALLSVEYARADSETWVPIALSGTGTTVATVPISLFQSHKSMTLRLMRGGAMELDTKPVTFISGGEDTAEREWIFLPSDRALTFGGQFDGHPLPSLITHGQVDPPGAATGQSADKDVDGWVPEGWYDEEMGVSEKVPYVYASYRDFISDEGSSDSSGSGDAEGTRSGHWGPFSDPSVWNHYNADGSVYRCRWTLGGMEVWQLTVKASGELSGRLPLVATLMRRIAGGSEEPVTASAITVRLSGLPNGEYQMGGNSPSVTIDGNIAERLTESGLTGVVVTFSLADGEAYSYSLGVVPENYQNSVKDTVREYGSELFLSKLHDDTAAGKITFQDVATFLQGLKIGEKDSIYGITGSGNATFKGITFDDILKSLGAIWGFENGRGILMDAKKGLIQTDGLEVRGFMRVMELIINRLQLLESDYSFTEGDTITHIDYEDNGQTLVLTMDKEHDTDFTPFYEGDIIYAEINDLLPHGTAVPDGHTSRKSASYYTSWMWVEEVDLDNNQLRVHLYPGMKNEDTPYVPGGSNFSPYGTKLGDTDVTAEMQKEYDAPKTVTDESGITRYIDDAGNLTDDKLQAVTLGQAGYDCRITVTRHGNMGNSKDQQVLQRQLGRQQSWVLSTTDQRITYFWRVDEPIVRDDNYALCLGILPQLDCLPYGPNGDPLWTVDMPSLFVNTVFYSHRHQINWPARIVKEDRGEWTRSPKVAYTGPTGSRTPDGTLDPAVAAALGWEKQEGSEEISFTNGQMIDESYHFEHITRNRWISRRLDAAYNRTSDAELYKNMTKVWTEQNDLETSRVWNKGALWECQNDCTTQEPWFDNSDWLHISGGMFSLGFYTDEKPPVPVTGFSVRPGFVNETVVPYLLFGQEDISNQVTAWSWVRESNNGELDETWKNTTHVDPNDLSSPLKSVTRKINIKDADLPEGWAVGSGRVSFKCTARFMDSDGEEAEIINSINIV